jgi:DNA-binding MarR family transcriptional regulator
MTARRPKTHSPTGSGDIAPALAAMDLTRELPYLLRRAHFEAEAGFNELFDDEGVTSRQSAILLTVLQRPGISQKDLGDHLGIDANTLSAMVARMLQRGLISRRRQTEDRRSYGLAIEPPGRKTLAKILPRIAEYQRVVTRRLGKGDREILVALLQRLLGLPVELA